MRNKSIEVTLEHKPNPDVQPSGYWIEPTDSGVASHVKVRSIEAAQRICTRYITRNHLGSGNWTGGEVLADGIAIGRVSYNGRYWPLAS